MDDLTPDEINELSKAMGGGDDDADEEGTDTNDAAPEEEASEEIEMPLEEGIELPLEEEATFSPAEETPAEEAGDSPNISHAQFMQLEEPQNVEDLPAKPIQRMYDVKVHVEVILGSTRMTLEEVLKLQSGSVVELNKLAGEPVEIIVNGRLIAKAEIVVIEDNFGVKVTEIVGSKHKFASL
jgi:flagellar motor switch protein FliN/FliY